MIHGHVDVKKETSEVTVLGLETVVF